MHVIVIGPGTMAAPIVHGIKKKHPDATFHLIKAKNTPPEHATYKDIPYTTDIDKYAAKIAQANLIVLGTKPDEIDTVCEHLAVHIAESLLVLSIAAGKTIRHMQSILGENVQMVRAMPNTPCEVEAGMTVADKSTNISTDNTRHIENIFQTIGKLKWGDEKDLNAVTAISGSGPGYIFYLIEAFATAKNCGELEARSKIITAAKLLKDNPGTDVKDLQVNASSDIQIILDFLLAFEAAAIATGLNENMSKILTQQTLIGSAKMTQENPEKPAAMLRNNVTSKNGTTFYGLNILMNYELINWIKHRLGSSEDKAQEIINNILQKTTQAAKNRADEMSEPTSS